MSKIIIIILIITSYFLNGNAISYENFIKYKVNNEIITNFDIDKEKRYLILLNPSLKNVSEKQLEELANESILFEKIKKTELDKFFNLAANPNDPVLNKILKGLYKKVGVNTEEDFAEYLTKYDLKLNWVRDKVEIETLWNNLIYNKYNRQVTLDIPSLEKEIAKNIKKNNKTKQYFLSEIFFEPKQGVDIKDLYLKIKNSIEQIGFDNTATIFSKSDTSKSGGKIGWVEESSLSPVIINEIKSFKKGEITNSIKLANNYLILKVDDIKIVEKKIDLKKALENKIMFERNNQLALFSIIYFNKIKQAVIIDEK